MIWKIENDNLYRTTYLSRDHNNDSLAEIIEGIEIENGKIILQNILGDIYILDKNEKYKEKEIKKFCDNYYIDYEDEYKFIYKIPYEKRWKRTSIINSKGNIVIFDGFKIDFSNEKYEKIKNNEMNVTKNIFGEKYRFEFKNFILLKIESKQEGSIYALVDKISNQIIYKIELKSDIIEIIHIDRNNYLCTFSENKNKIFLINLSINNFIILDSKEYNYNFTSDWDEHKLFIRKYKNQIFLLDNTI